jgi:hypothetical protein
VRVFEATHVEALMSHPIGSAEENEERKYLVGLEVSLEERLAWLLEMQEIALSTGALPRRRNEWGQEVDD